MSVFQQHLVHDALYTLSLPQPTTYDNDDDDEDEDDDDALYTLSLPHPTTEISWLMLACLFRCSKMPPVYLEPLLDNFFKYSSNALKCFL